MQITFDHVELTVPDWTLQGEPEPGQIRTWWTRDGDGVGIFLFNKPPDLPVGARSLDQLREFYVALADGTSASLVELSIGTVDFQRAVETVVRVPQPVSGSTFVGTLTVPYRDFSIVMKGQCAEAGPTGAREAYVLDQRLAAGDIPTERASLSSLPNWNPYHARFDGVFPNHPISRLRTILHRFRESTRISKVVQRAPGFTLPDPGDELSITRS